MQEKIPVILVIEDELAIRRFLKTALINQGYRFLETATGSDGLKRALEDKPDIILLDLGLPDMDGTKVITQLRTWTSTPIIILSARDQEHDKVLALDLGADDYLSKPFSVGELNARLRVALRHGERINEVESPVFRSGALQVDLVNREVCMNKEKVVLSPIQFSILSVLVRKANKIVTHKQLLREVWGEEHTGDLDYLRIYIHQLRHKIEQNPAQPEYLKTEQGVGYRLAVKNESAVVNG